jgi:hypothetical protein
MDVYYRVITRAAARRRRCILAISSTPTAAAKLILLWSGKLHLGALVNAALMTRMFASSLVTAPILM